MMSLDKKAEVFLVLFVRQINQINKVIKNPKDGNETIKWIPLSRHTPSSN